MPIAFVLSAGGSLGDFEVGALRYLYNRGIVPEIVCGSSVGAINGAAIAQGPGGIEKLESIWLSMILQSDMYTDQPWVDLLPANGKSILRKILNALREQEAIFFPVILLNEFAVAVPDIVGLVSGVIDLITHSMSAWDPSPLAAKVRANLDPVAVSGSGIKLRIATCSLEGGNLRLIDETARFTDGNHESVNLADAVLASAAIPVYFPPVSLGGQNYVDGGVRTLVPIRAALDAGATQIIAIVAPPSGVGQADPPKSLLDVGYRSLQEQYDQILSNDINPPQGWPVPVTFIQAQTFVHESMQIEPGLIAIAMADGFMRAADVMTGASHAASGLSASITALRMDIWDAEHSANNHLAPRHRPPEPVPPGGVDAAEYWLPYVRERKRSLRDLVASRRSLFSVAPSIVVLPETLDFGSVPVPGSGLSQLTIVNAASGGVPADASKWWTDWERHPWTPIVTTPWEGFVYFGTDFGQETPPDPVGGTDLHVGAIASDNPAFQADPSSAVVGEGASLVVSVRFTPIADGEVDATLTITSDAGITRVPLTGRGKISPPTISVLPSALNFGIVVVGNTAERSIVIRNIGSSNLTIDNIVLEPSDSVFQFIEVPSPGDVIPPLGAAHVSVQFAPEEVQLYEGTLHIDSSDAAKPHFPVPLRGRGVQSPSDG